MRVAATEGSSEAVGTTNVVDGSDTGSRAQRVSQAQRAEGRHPHSDPRRWRRPRPASGRHQEGRSGPPSRHPRAEATRQCAERARHRVGRTGPPLRPLPRGACRVRKYLRPGRRRGTALVVRVAWVLWWLGRRGGVGRTGMIRRGERQHLGERRGAVLGRVPAPDGGRRRHVPGALGRADDDGGGGGTHVAAVPDCPESPARESTAGT